MRYKPLLLGIVLVCVLSASPARAAGVGGDPAIVRVKAGAFTKTTSIGPQAVTEVGFKPKLVILSGVARTSDGFAAGYQYGFGASDGATSGAISGWSWDARGLLGSDTDRRQAAKAITFTRTIAGIEAEAALISFDDDGFTLNWTTNNASPWIINYLAIGGDTVEAKVSSFDAGNHCTGPKSYTHVGFRPDALLMFGAPSAVGPLEASLGFADLGGNQFAMSVASQDTGVNPTNTARYQRTDRCFASLDPANRVIRVVSEASFVSMDSAGFTLNWTTAEVGPGPLISVAIRGVRAKVGSISGEMYGGDASYAGLGFQPRGGMFVGFNDQASSTVLSSNRFTVGMAGQDGSESSIWVSDQDNVVNDTQTDQAVYDHECYIGENSGVSPLTFDTAATLKSLDADGFTLTWSGFSAGPAQIGYLLLGDPVPAAAVGGIAEYPEPEAQITASSHGASAANAFALAGLAGGATLLLAAGGWYARRRWRAG